jgi:hypothetical protein
MRKNFLLPCFLMALLMNSCGQSKTDNKSHDAEGQYILSLSLPAQSAYPFQVVRTPESGVADIGNARPIPEVPNSVLVAGKDGFVYLNSKEKLTRYAVRADNSLEEKGSVPNTGLLGGPISAFLDQDRLLVSTAPRQVSDSLFAYQIINTSDMTELVSGNIKLPVTKGSVASPSMYIVKEGKVLVPYIHADEQNHAYGKANLAIFNAQDMTYEKTISTEKTACLGYSVVSSHAFTEYGDLYIVSSNSNYWGGNESLPSCIVRIRKGETDFDKSYFLNLSAQLNGNHSGGMIYAGSDKVVVQVFESSLVKAYKDYQQGYVISYYEADLKSKSLKKLDVPLSKYPRRALERLKNGKVAIAINAENGENALYIYDADTETVKKGLVYHGAEYLSGLLAF